MSTPNPVTIVPFEQSAAMLATVAAINAFAKTPADKLAAAMTAQSVASILQDAANGNASAIDTEAQALIANIKDPGLAAVARDLIARAQPYIQVVLAANGSLPLVGATEQAVLGNIAAGMKTAAQAYISAPASKS